ncbi:DUF1800 domain-containing protein [Amylibacter sp. IMCC11727]|uniref:DUF1800 domain-containing protein n=1 Tax=Amylibacter sp. IMCC11727 TaxID=3039851 RepID=UPI00244DCC6A|nr:DUF1800 domain-containing protein [Amylibacter sp. IMCC11727]WGI21138.1 DUF1800 domain-containing protein [Amylibacter sp. IMCC11727]
MLDEKAQEVSKVQSFATKAAFRFGYGFAAGEADVRDVDALLRQVTEADAGIAAYAGPSFADRAQLMRDYLKHKRAAKKGDAGAKPLLRASNKERNALRAADMRRVFGRALYAGQGFRERLVFFWADHFTVVPKSRLEQTVWGSYQEEAIRPHVNGSFGDMLVAAATHPSMLLFLDQVRSIGPNSKAAKNGKKRRKVKGLNENLAREVMELHTLGVGGAYSQTDVRQAAELLTGLVVGEDGAKFLPRWAEPGAEDVLGKRYGGDPAKMSDIEAFLRDLALHPDTARHVAQKLVVHFISDEPDPKLVDELTRVYTNTDGDLPSVYGAMLDHPAAWVDLGQKARQPFEFMVASLRALGIAQADFDDLATGQVNRGLNLPLNSMGQPLRSAPGPNGWPEEPEAWITAQGLASRLQWALAISRRLGRDTDPRDFVELALRELAGGSLKFAVGGAEQREEGLTLVLASPEFNRR